MEIRESVFGEESSVEFGEGALVDDGGIERDRRDLRIVDGFLEGGLGRLLVE